MTSPRRPLRLLPFLPLIALAACSPRLDWREARPEGAGLLALFPCKPEVDSRPATAAQPVRMGLAQCKAGETSFSISWAEVADPGLVTAALQEMRGTVAAKLGAASAPGEPVQVPGMTPNPQARVLQVAGPQAGQQAQLAVFTRGRLVYQALMLGGKRDDAAWQTFLGSIRLES